jgi:hypothetical protein
MNMIITIIQHLDIIIQWVTIKAKMVYFINIVDYRQYAFKSNQIAQPKTASSRFLQFEHSPEELLP